MFYALWSVAKQSTSGVPEMPEVITSPGLLTLVAIAAYLLVISAMVVVAVIIAASS